MGRILIVAEKPSVANDIARVLGCTKKGEGFIESDRYIVSWALGHLVALCEPEEYDAALKKWSFDTLPIIPDNIKLKAIKKTSKQLTVLKKLMNSKDTDSIICATDSGREGELIFRYIYEYVKCKKPFKRLWISSMTDEAIKEGFLLLKDSGEYDSLYQSAKCRSEADWLVGMNASRAYTIRHNALLSVGRVQTPTLFMLVKRQKEINDFVSEDYYEVEADYGSFKGLWYREKYGDTRIDDISIANEIKERVKGKDALVDLVKKETKRDLPPLLYDLTELQRTANRLYGFSAKKTLDLAQKLYERHKLITYPRTDSRYLTGDMPVKVASAMKKLLYTDRYKPIVSRLDLNKLNYTKRIIDNAKVSDHHAIIPTDKKTDLSSLSEDEFKVFDLVARRFAAVFYPPYEYMVTTVAASCDGDKFVSKGKTEISRGWHDAEIINEKEKKDLIPDNVNKGDILNIKSAVVLNKKTQPPKPYTEATLLSAMENAGRDAEDETLREQMKDSGLGTPATRAAVIERLLSVGYIKRSGKSLIPEEKGIKLCETVPLELKSPQTTGKWEKGLSSIAKGKMQPERFMGSIKRFVLFIIDDAANNNSKVEFEREERHGSKKSASLGKCPICGGKVLENSKAFYCSNWKSGCAFKIWKDILDRYGNRIDAALVKKLLKDGKAEKIKLTLPQTGESGTGTLVLSREKNFAAEVMDFQRNQN
ncbi:DNA topoisomerase III [Lachnospiraceae bacterium NSJ-143]|nr:DNA topoisomerase III [Lachnospiraceae bacterium NSJ-143]